MIELNLNALLQFLKEQGLQASIQQETQQVYAPLQVEQREFPFFSRVFDQSGLLQLLVFIPCKLQDKTLSDVCRLLHMFNKELDIPGFGLDEVAGVVFFRCMVPGHDGEIPEDTVLSFLQTLKTVCNSFSPAVEAMAAGAITFDQMLAKAKEAQKNLEKENI